MSLVRSAALFEHGVVYKTMDGNNTSDLPSSMSDSNNGTPITDSDSFDPIHCLDSPSDATDYDEDRMRIKLRELEQALLDDNATYGDETDYHIHRHTVASSSDLKKLLFECAAAIHNGNLQSASGMIDVLRQRVSIQGEPADRIAAYMVEALAARMATSGRGLYRALKCKEPPSTDRLSAMQVLFEVCPCFRFGFLAANGAILEACKDEKTVHIVDFDINQGSQYYTLLQALARFPGNHPHIRLTGVDDPESVQRAIGGLNIIGRMLEQLARDLHVPFEFHAVAAETALVSPPTLACRPGEALVVNFAFQLHHMPDESVSTINLRDKLLRMVKSLKPKLVTVVEQDVNTNTSPFLARFAEAYSYYSAVFESLDATLSRDKQERINVEKHCLARDIINVVACEGEERIERYEVAGKWRARMSMAGFQACPVSQNVKDEIQGLIRQYSDRYRVKEETGALHFGWEDKILIVSSANFSLSLQLFQDLHYLLLGNSSFSLHRQHFVQFLYDSSVAMAGTDNKHGIAGQT